MIRVTTKIAMCRVASRTERKTRDAEFRLAS